MSSPRLMDQVRHRLRAMKRAYSTEKAYVDWILQYIRFHGIVHPKEMGTEDIDAFLTHLAVDRNVTASTQNQARSALVFLYSQVLKMDLKIGADAVRAKESMHLPVVMWEDEVAEVLQVTTGRDELMLTMLYGGGLRGKELLSLRYKDIDFNRGQLLVRDAKGAKDRYTLLPKAAYEALKRQLKSVEIRLQHDLESGFPGVYLPFAIEEKYPNAACSLAWQFVFPARAASIDPRTGKRRLHHLHKSSLRRAVSKAARKTKIQKHVKVHTFRHSFATHLLMSGIDVRTVQQLMGHKSIKTTEVYLHVLRSCSKYITSPADALLGTTSIT